MRCKECKEKIADNVKYCPECGALVNDIKYNYTYPHQNYQQQRTSTPVYNQRSYEAPADDEQKTLRFPKPSTGFPKIKKLSIIVIGVIVLVYVIGVLSSVFNSVKDDLFNDSVVNVIEDESIYSYDADSFMFDYINNIVDCDINQIHEDFLYASALDWESIYSDLFYCEELTTPSGDPVKADTGMNADPYGFMNAKISSGFKNLNSIYPENFTPYYFTIDTTYSYEMDASEIQTYCDLIRKSLADAGLESEDYFDLSSADCIYNYSCFVYSEDEECVSRYDVGTFNVIVVESDGTYSILYDDVFIQGLLDSLV